MTLFVDAVFEKQDNPNFEKQENSNNFPNECDPRV